VLFKGSHSTDLHHLLAALEKIGKRISPDPVAVRTRVGNPVPSRTASGGPSFTVTEIPPMRGKEGSRLASVVFLGDLSMGDYYLSRRRLRDVYQRLEKDPWSFVELLAPLVEDKSLLLANLETVLAERPADPFAGRKGYQGWDQPERTLSILRRLGVDAVSLANNHTMDYGAAPLLATISHLKASGIIAFGAGANETEAARPLSFAAPVGNLHIFAGFEFRASYARRWNFYASGDAPGVNPLSNGETPVVSDAIAHTRAKDPGSVIVVYPHWSGSTNYQWANDEMVKLNRGFHSAGADLVIGHGAHRMQEIISNPEGTTVFSLGNFVFNSPGRYRKLGEPPFSLVARLDLEWRGGGVTGGLRLYPIVSDNQETGFRPKPVQEFEAVEVYNTLARRCGGGFRDGFALEQDERGWYVTQTATLTPRFAGQAR
jgi:UDP-N-acetylmuramoyl-tripeptide--D-alanyl-D-alanine ligase